MAKFEDLSNDRRDGEKPRGLPSAFERQLRRQQSRIRTIRIALIVLATLTFFLLGVTFLVQNETLIPQNLRVGLSEQGDAVIVTHKTDFTVLSNYHEIIYVKADSSELTTTTGPYKGICNGVEFLGNGEFAIFLDGLATVYEKPNGEGEAWEAKPRIIPYPFLPTRNAAASATEDNIVASWITENRISAQMGGDLEAGTLPFKLVKQKPKDEADKDDESGETEQVEEELEMRVKGLGVFYSAGRIFQIILTEKNNLMVVHFKLEKVEVEKLESENGVSETEGEGSEPGGSEEIETSEKDSGAPQPTFVYRPVDVNLDKVITGQIKDVATAASQNRVLVAYKRSNEDPDDEIWQAIVFHAGRWSDDKSGDKENPKPLVEYELGDISPSAKGAESETPLKPILALSGERLFSFGVGEDGRSITRKSAVLADKSALEWNEEKPWVLDRMSIPIEVDTLILLMVVMLSGTVVCMVWLGLNREQDIERALNVMVESQVGRDTTKLGKPVGMALVDRMAWAGPLRRVIAFHVDLLVVMLPIVGIISLRELSAEKALNLVFQQPEYLLDGLQERLIALFVIAVYGFICEVWFDGRTLGKRLLKMRVVAKDGRGVGVFPLFVRNFVRVIELAHPLTILISMFCILLTRRHQRIGDVFSGTAIKIDAASDDDGKAREMS